MSDLQIKKASQVINAGGVIAYPTEAVWGLGCDPQNREACLALLQIKQRPVEKGMILVAGSITQFEPLLAPLSSEQRAKLEHSWANQDDSGPVTWLVPDVLAQVPWWIKGEHGSVALRVSTHPLVRQLCLAVGSALVSSSANVAGARPARTRLRVEQTLGAKLDYVLPGALGGATQPSQIIDLNSGQLIRA